MTILFRSAVAALFLIFPSAFFHLPPPAFAQEDPDSKGDVSTENNPNLGQIKEQKILEESKADERSTEKKEPNTGPDRPANTGHNETRTERPQRFERPIRPERPQASQLYATRKINKETYESVKEFVRVRLYGLNRQQ